MSTDETSSETFADKAKAQFDALKTKEGRDALKSKAMEGVEGAKKLWIAASILQRVVVLAAVVIVTIFFTRSCGGDRAVTATSAPSVISNASQEADVSSKNIKATDLTKENQNIAENSFAGFKFGASVDDFENVIPVKWAKDFGYDKDDKKVWKNLHTNYMANVSLKKDFRLFDSATLYFTEDKRLYKVELKIKPERLTGYKPTSILREAQFCAAIIERRYGQCFDNKASRLYAKREMESGDYLSDVLIGDSISKIHYHVNKLSDTIGTSIYSTILVATEYAVSPYAYFHGFFNNMLEIECTCGLIFGKNAYLGITISAIDHNIIEEIGGRTKMIPFGAHDDEGNL